MFKLEGFSSKFGFLLVAGAVVAVTEGTGYAVTQDQYADMINAKTDTEVWNLLRGTGIGKCRVAQGNTTCCACNYYFKTGYVDSLGYDGAPIYNTDDSDHLFYAGTSTASRMTPTTPISTQHSGSTGCFPQAGYGLFGGAAKKWEGNNTSEVTTAGDQYAKNLLVQLIRDPGDPCKINDVIAKLGTSYQVEATVTSSSTKFSFANRGDGKPDPTKCFIDGNTTVLVNGVQRHVKNPYGNAAACKTIFRRIVNVLNKGATGTTTTAVPLISKEDQDLANTLTNGTFSAAVTAAYDTLFRQAAATSTVYKTQTTSTTLTSAVNFSATLVPLSSLNLVMPSLKAAQ